MRHMWFGCGTNHESGWYIFIEDWLVYRTAPLPEPALGEPDVLTSGGGSTSGLRITEAREAWSGWSRAPLCAALIGIIQPAFCPRSPN